MTLDRAEQDGPLLMGTGGRPLFLPRGEASPALSLVHLFSTFRRWTENWENIHPFPQIPSCFSSPTDLFCHEFAPSFLPPQPYSDIQTVPDVEGLLCVKH